FRSGQRIYGLAQTLDRRAHHCVAQSLPKARQGLGESQPKGARVLAPRLNPSHAQKTLQSNVKSPDGLLKAKGRLASSSEAILSTPRRKRWTLDDDQRLMDLRAKDASFNEIAIAVGRTEAALEQRAHNLKPPSCVALSRTRT